MQEPIKLMIADDAAIVRSMLGKIIENDESLKITMMVSNGLEAVNGISNNKDIEVILLDIQMPVMDGLDAIPLLLQANPKLKIIVVSSLAKTGAIYTVKALSLGAADYIEKPNNRAEIESFSKNLLLKIHSLGLAARGMHTLSQFAFEDNKDQQISNEIKLIQPRDSFNLEIIAIASSTGGPKALMDLLSRFSEGFLQNYPILITQHIKKDFVSLFVSNLSSINKITCKEAQNGEAILKGVIYIAPSDVHLEVTKQNDLLFINLTDSPPENFCRPSADPMFRSLAKISSNILAIILTGIGQDGLKGAQEIVQTGGVVIAQDKETSVVWGMPGAVATHGLCSNILPINEIASYIEKRFT